MNDKVGFWDSDHGKHGTSRIDSKYAINL
jgi:hypothetical protein